MFVPLHDGVALRHIRVPWVTYALILANVAIWLITLPYAPVDGSAGAMALSYGHIPSVSNDLRVLPEAFRTVPDHLYFLTTLSYAFLHADIWHLGGNMLFLWVFGDNVEDAMGPLKYLIFYLLAAIAASWLHAFVFPTSDSPLIGASGAASGVVAAYMMLHPRVWIWGLVLGRIPLRLPAFLMIGLWIGFQVLMFLTDTEESVSWAAHIGGVLCGIVLVGLLKRRDVALFDKGLLGSKPNRSSEDQSNKPVWGRKS